MSEENVEVVKEVFEGWEARDPEAALRRIDPNVEVDLTASSIWGDWQIRRGHDALQQAVAQLLESWKDMEFSPENFIDAGNEVVVWLRITARGRESGVPTERYGASAYTVRDGMVIRWRAFETLAEAAKAVGI